MDARYWADGGQRELSFTDELDGSGRPRCGRAGGSPGTHSSRSPPASARVFTDPRLGGIRFAGTESARAADRDILHAHVGPVLGDRALAVVAQARDDVADLADGPGRGRLAPLWPGPAGRYAGRAEPASGRPPHDSGAEPGHAAASLGRLGRRWPLCRAALAGWAATPASTLVRVEMTCSGCHRRATMVPLSPTA